MQSIAGLIGDESDSESLRAVSIGAEDSAEEHGGILPISRSFGARSRGALSVRCYVCFNRVNRNACAQLRCACIENICLSCWNQWNSISGRCPICREVLVVATDSDRLSIEDNAESFSHASDVDSHDLNIIAVMTSYLELHRAELQGLDREERAARVELVLDELEVRNSMPTSPYAMPILEIDQEMDARIQASWRARAIRAPAQAAPWWFVKLEYLVAPSLFAISVAALASIPAGIAALALTRPSTVTIAQSSIACAFLPTVLADDSRDDIVTQATQRISAPFEEILEDLHASMCALWWVSCLPANAIQMKTGQRTFPPL
eukprot:TRINITY_DN41293_c0_g1_i1.p1 TRINITY_DN41293_c0_g1~~TRINITY_DN41293_c0_g1_i1.p1  ORF type:complete len:320 (+),score=28.96 TRINITY_DN41293_c0_g1_i1:78-1037(+)